MCEVQIIDGTIENLKYYDHKRAKNWVAIVKSDLSQPGGLHRTFLRRAPGGRVFVEGVELGQWIEFAGDYYSARGSKSGRRSYYRVVEIGRRSDEPDMGVLRLEGCEKDEVGKPTSKVVDDTTEAANPLAAYTDAEIMAEVERRGLASDIVY